MASLLITSGGLLSLLLTSKEEQQKKQKSFFVVLWENCVFAKAEPKVQEKMEFYFHPAEFCEGRDICLVGEYLDFERHFFAVSGRPEVLQRQSLK